MSITIDNTSTSNYLRLPLAIFRNHTAPDADLYCLPDGHEVPSLVASRQLGITTQQLDSLEQKGQTSLYISKSDLNNALAPLFESLDAIVSDNSISGDERFAVLQFTIAQEFDRTYRQTSNGPFIALASRIGTLIANLVLETSLRPHELYVVARHETTGHVHLTNSAAYAVMLAQMLGVSKQEQLQQIAVGAMLHDIGERSISRDILQKPGKLTQEEREIIERHPQNGYEALCELEQLSLGQLMMVYQHHEWINGRGYPVAILGKEIHPWAKILTVVDVFDAMTASRPYCPGVDVNNALHFLEDGAGTQFEPEAVKCWTSNFRQPSQK